MTEGFPPIPARPRTSEMTFWSRYDPVAMPRGNTDHWSKLKQRTSAPPGHWAAMYRVSTMPQGYQPTAVSMDPVTGWIPPSRKRLTEKSFDDFVLDGLHGTLPGGKSYSMGSQGNKYMMRSCYNDRARDGFRYWLIERPKPTSFGRYGLGSFKTVLGVGNAPRT